MLVDRHPSLELRFATANAQRGQTMRLGAATHTFIASEEAQLDEADLIFAALPHGASLEWVEKARDAGAKVVDLSADLRPGNGGSLRDGSQAPYGLTELNRAELRMQTLLQIPGAIRRPFCWHWFRWCPPV